MPSTTQDHRLPDELDLPLAGSESRRLSYVGPGSSGLVYRCSRRRYYRLLPIRAPQLGPSSKRSEDCPIERRSRIEQEVGRHRTEGHRVAIAQAETVNLHGREVYVVEYDIDGARSLQEVLEEDEPLERMTHCFNALPWLEQWWQWVCRGFCPMPADLILDSSNQVYLLWLPEWRPPDLESVFEEPMRGFSLSPDYVRNSDDPGVLRSLDIYALGHLLSRCLYNVGTTKDWAAVLTQKMTGSLAESERCIPFWFDWLPEFALIEAGIARMLSPDPLIRSAIDLDGFYKSFLEIRPRLNLEGAVGAIEKQYGTQVAFIYLKRIMTFENDYDVYLRGARICATEFDLPVEAIDTYELAIAFNPQKEAAYLLESRLIASADARPALEKRIRANPGGASVVDSRMHRNHRKLDGFAGNDDAQLSWGQFLLWRHSETAASYAFEQLLAHDENGRWAFWWRLLYIEALSRVGDRAGSRAELDRVQQDFVYAHDNGIVPRQLLREQGLKFNELNATWKTRFQAGR